MNGILNQVNLLEKGLDAVWLRHEVISNNVANADTPDFKASQVTFESMFADALDAASKSDSVTTQSGETISQRNTITRLSTARALDSSGIKLDSLQAKVLSTDSTMRMDGNNVDPDAEMAALAENTILYDTMTYALNKELGRLKMVINDGK